MAVVAIPLAIAAAATVASSVMSANAQKAQASQQADSLRYQAQAQQDVTALQNAQIQRKAEAVAGHQLALSGASGVDTSGSVADDIGQTAANAARDQFANNFNGSTKADSLYTSASNFDAQGSQALSNGLIGAGLKVAGYAGGSLLNSLGSGWTPSTKPMSFSNSGPADMNNPSTWTGGL